MINITKTEESEFRDEFNSQQLQTQLNQNVQNQQTPLQEQDYFYYIPVETNYQPPEFVPTTKIRELNKNELREYRCFQKQKQNTSIILRTIVYMRILVNNFGYTAIFRKQLRKARVGLTYYPIEKLYNSNGDLLFDMDQYDKMSLDRKFQYCQIYVIDLMIKELEKQHYIFKKKQTKKAFHPRGNYEPISLTKVFSFHWIGPKNHKYEFEMTELEETLGMSYYEYLNGYFSNVSVERVILGKINVVNAIVPTLVFKNPIHISCVVGYDTTEIPAEINYSLKYLSYVQIFMNEYTQLMEENKPKEN